MIRVWLMGLLMLLGFGSIPAKSPAAEPVISPIAKGNNAFAFALYRELAKDAKPTENIWFSPYSIQAALAMTYAGARGKTADEMSSVLGFEANQERFHPAFAQHAKSLQTFSKDFKGAFNLANAIWVDDGLEVPKPFREMMNVHHGAGLRTIDFGASEAARKQINDWVGENTKGKIPELLPDGSIDSDTRMVLANALYFQANWRFPFDQKSTHDAEFFQSAKKAIRVPMMFQKSSLRYGETSDAQLVELPYDKSDFTLLLAVPKKGKEVSDIEAKLGQIDTALPTMKTQQVELLLPRFNLEAKAQLKSALTNLGMPTAFTSKADFSGIGSDLAIGDVYHAATVAVDERGTVAAAATAVTIVRSSLEISQRVEVNRPSLVIIRHVPTNSIMFLGRLSDPQPKK